LVQSYEYLDREQVISLLEAKIIEIEEAIVTSFDVSYNPVSSIVRRDGKVYLGKYRRQIKLYNKASIKNFYHITVTMKILLNLLKNPEIKIATLREVFYQRVSVFRNQSRSDSAIETIMDMLLVTRDSLGVIAASKSIVTGNMIYEESGDLIDCRRMGDGGKAITSNAASIANIDVLDSKYVLIVEKDGPFAILNTSKFWKKYPGIIVTGKGQPDIAVRQLLKMIRDVSDVPIYAMVDADPYGYLIYKSYVHGSDSLAGYTPHITVDAEFIGAKITDLLAREVDSEVLLKLNKNDRRIIRSALKAKWATKEMKLEFETMLERNVKAEMQAYSNLGTAFLYNEYLPEAMNLE
jgi:meiotic recombination protein SPO11